MMDADYVNDLALFANTPVQAKSQLRNLEQTVRSLGHYANADKTVYIF